MSLFADTILAIVLVAVLIVAVVVFFRWSQRNIKANTRRIKQELFEEASGPASIEVPASAARLEGEGADLANQMLAQLDDKIAAVSQRVRAVEDRIARLEQSRQLSESAVPPAPRGGSPPA